MKAKAEKNKPVEWLKVKRVRDGLVMQIPDTAYEEKHFTLIDEETEANLAAAREQAGMNEPEEDEEASEEIEDAFEELEPLVDEDEEIEAAGEEEAVADVPSDMAYDEATLKALTYAELKEVARKYEPELKGNTSRAKCREIILSAQG